MTERIFKFDWIEFPSISKTRKQFDKIKWKKIIEIHHTKHLIINLKTI